MGSERNQWVGIRTPSTMRSDQAWMAGHRAALRLTPVFLFTTVLSCVALVAAALYGSTRGIVAVVGFGRVAAVEPWPPGTVCNQVQPGRLN